MKEQDKKLTTEGHITKHSPENESMDYEVLRENGMELIRQYAAKTWTDHNIHDPGITILEILCYAMTELGLKANSPVEDLLKGGKGAYNDLYKAVDILPSTPITQKDYRKFLIDHEQVRNAWIDKHTDATDVSFYYDPSVEDDKKLNYNEGQDVIVQGLYDILIEFMDDELNTNLISSTLSVNGNDYNVEVIFPYWDELTHKNTPDMEIQDVTVKTVPGTGGSTGIPVQKFQEDQDGFFAVMEINYSDVAEAEDFGVHIRFDPAIEESDRDDILQYIDTSTPGELVELLTDTTENSIIQQFVNKNNTSKAIIGTIKTFLHDHRNLAEDFYRFRTARTQEIAVLADIDIRIGTSVEEIVAEVFFALDQFISPQVQFTSFEDLINKGYKTEEIFEGPGLQHGFLEEIRLVANERRDPESGEQLIYVSDLFNLIKSLNGQGIFEDDNSIIDLRNLSISNYINNQLVTEKARNCLMLTLSNIYKPRISLLKSDIRVFKEGEKVSYDMEAVLEIVHSKRALLEAPKTYPVDVLDIPSGKDMDINQYYSIQHHFPLTYGIGEEGLPESASNERKAQAKQLKSYLLLFEQVYTNFQAQLDHLKELFSFNSTTDRTYFTGILEDIPGLSALLNNNYLENIEEITETNGQGMLERKNRFLNHLAARFGEDPHDFRPLFKQSYTEVLDKLINIKRNLLQQYPSISKNRFKAFHQFKLKEDNTPDMWDTGNVSGFEKRVCYLLGFSTCHRRHLYNPFISFFEIYEEDDTDSISEKRFRLKDHDDNILLSSSTRYTDTDQMEDDIREVVLHAGNRDNYEVITGTDDNLYFNLQNPDGETIARRIEPFDDEEEIENAIQEVIAFTGYTLTGEGFHLIEHLLLRPTEKGSNDANTHELLPTYFYHDEQQTFPDPYSFQLTVVMPSGYQRDFNADPSEITNIPGMERFRDHDFRRHMDRVLQNEAPAHTLIRIFRIDVDTSGTLDDTPSLNNFERVYKDWLNTRVSPTATKPAKISAQRALVQTIDNIFNPPQS